MSRTVTPVPAAPALPVTPHQRSARTALATPWDGASLTPPPVLRVRFGSLAGLTASAGTDTRVAVDPHNLLRTPFGGHVIDLPTAVPVDFSALVGPASAAVPAPRGVSGSH